MLYNDHFGWPITARSYSSTGTRELIEVAEVLNQMVRRACLFKPVEDQRTDLTTASTTITTTTTTVNLSLSNRRVKSSEWEKDDVLKEPVQAVASDLVSLISKF